MDILKSLMANKSILNSALRMLKSAFLKDGITAVFITPSDDDNSDTPGMKIQSYGGPVAILTGDDLVEVSEYFRRKSEYGNPDRYVAYEVSKEVWDEIPKLRAFAERFGYLTGDEKKVDHV